MGYLLLILGVLLWSGAHFFKRLAPERRAAMGEAGKGLVAVLSVISIVLMVVGYGRADPVILWDSPRFLTHLNNLLMLFAVYLFAVSGMKTGLARVIRHPQLTAVKTWAIAHLLVNGDLASLILFGGLLAWAVISVILINRANRAWTKPAPAAMGKEIGAIIGAVVVMGVISWLHMLVGPSPFG